MRIFFINNILTQSITLLPVSSNEYVLRKVRNIFPIQKEQALIRIFALTFDYGNIFSKSTANMDKNKKEIFRMDIVKKGLVFAVIQYAVLKFTYHRCFAHAQLKL